MTTHFLDKSNSCNLKRGGRRKFIARLTPKFFICLKFKTVTAPHNIVFYALSPSSYCQYKTHGMHT